jgi:hypothetical protein
MRHTQERAFMAYSTDYQDSYPDNFQDSFHYQGDSFPSDYLYSSQHYHSSENPVSFNNNSLTYPSDQVEDDFSDEVTRAYTATSSSLPSDCWIADSGATDHMTDQLHWFSDFTPLPTHANWPVETPAGHKIFVKGTGNIKILVQLPDRTEIHLLKQVLYIPDFGRNLFSLTKVAQQQKIFTLCRDKTCELLLNNDLIMTGRMINGSYILDFTVLIPPVQVSYASSFGNIPISAELQSIDTWHQRLSHLHHDMIRKMATNGSVTGLRLKDKEPDGICSGCAFGKSHRTSFPKNRIRDKALQPGMLIHSDICGPMSVPSYGGSLYYILFQDDCTRYRFVFCIQKKSEALICFQRVCKAIFRDTGFSVQTLRTDNASEYCSKRFSKYLEDAGIKHELSVPYNPEQNSVSEHSNRTIMEAVRSCIFHSKVDSRFWAEAVDNVVYTLNRTCSRLLLDTTPFEAYTRHKPSVAHMRPFGCKVFTHIPKELRKKLSPKSREGIFLGYADTTKGYRIWDIEKQQVILSRDVLFDENKFVSSTTSEPLKVSILPVNLEPRNPPPIPPFQHPFPQDFMPPPPASPISSNGENEPPVGNSTQSLFTPPCSSNSDSANIPIRPL